MGLLEEQPQRMAREKRQLEALVRDEGWLTLGGWALSANGDLELSFSLKSLPPAFDGVLVYPPFFPEVPAFIRPQRRAEAWSAHQYGGTGVLCLERGADNWDTRVTGVDLVRSANKLLWSEAIQAVMPHIQPVPSRHQLTLGQELRGENRRFLLTAGFFERLAGATPCSAWPMEVRTTKVGECSVTCPTAVGENTPQPLSGAPVLSGAERSDGWVFSVSTQPAKPMKLAELVAVADAAGRGAADLHGKTIVVLGPPEQFRAYEVLAAGSLTALKVIDVRPDEAARLPVEYIKLASLRVAVIGLGSLGGKIAVSLARSGARKFTLIDADVLLPQNLVRNDLDWRSVGFAKVEAVAERIHAVAPDAEVLPLSFEVAGQENSLVAARLADVIANCDLVVDATASSDAFLLLAAICKRAGVPLVWGEVFAGGFGALMARSRPGLDADPLRIRSHILGVMSGMQPVPRLEAGRYALDVGGQVMVAGDADVSHLAAALTAFAIDAVCGPSPSEYPVAAYILGFKRYWEFKAPFDTIPIECPGPIADAPAVTLTEEESSALAELSNAVQRSAGAAGNGSS